MVYAIFSASVLLAVGTVYAAAVGWLYFWQERVLFEPDPLREDEPICTDCDTHELFIDVPGARLSVANLKLKNPRGVFFFMHGNSGNLKKWFVELEAFRQANFDVVMFDYRGFGKSTGEIESEEQLRADVHAVWEHFAPLYEGKRVVISGQSLGTGLAAELYPWVPMAVLRYPLRTLEHAAKLLGPVMLIHGEKDELIPIHHSEALCKTMKTAQLLRVDGAGHSDVHQFPSVRKALLAALGRL
jgi:uncharacterized protein